MANKPRWTVDKWTTQVIPEFSKLWRQHRNLSLRENVILTSAILDAALTDVISKRLMGPEDEIILFLGANSDGRAPCGSFGSRIQLALLLGIIDINDVTLLRRLKKLRNDAAHKIDSSISSPDIESSLLSIWELFKLPMRRMVLLVEAFLKGDERLMRFLESEPEWPKYKDQIDVELSKLKQLTKTSLPTNGTTPPVAETPPVSLPDNGLTSKIAIEALVPRLLKHSPVAGNLMLALVLAVYHTRFQEIAKNLTRLTPIATGRIIPMWNDDWKLEIPE